MSTFIPDDPASQVENMPMRHTFILLGEKQLFGVHMTQYHTEVHKYQMIFKLSLPEKIHQQYLALRAQNPKDTWIICNAKESPEAKPGEVREFVVPDIAAGLVTKFTANIFQGIPPFPHEDMADPQFFPWSTKYARPAIEEFEVTVERIVTFRPFDHLATLQTYATYLLFGDSKSGETHMTNLQTARLATKLLEPPAFGPDYDHIMSLKERPDWLQQDALLEAGIIVTTPEVRLIDADSGEPVIPVEAPFKEGEEIEVLYRGMRPVRSLIAGPSYLFCSAVCNSPQFFGAPVGDHKQLTRLPKVQPVCEFTPMPEKYWPAT